MMAWVFGLLAFLTAGESGSTNKGLAYTDLSHNFGHVALDFTVIAEYPIFNEGAETYTIDSVRANCDCSHAFAIDTVLAPGDTTQVRLSFTTTNFFGPNNKQLVVYTSDPDHPKMTFFYLATVGQWLKGLKPDPVSLFFLPPHKSKSISLTNNGFSRIELAFAGTPDSLFDVNITSDLARRGEQVSAEIVPFADLSAGTYLTNARFQVTVPEQEPVFLTIPVKIVRY
ncbi:DUF1573 domain-containing protein [candidate division GN15 bacterium]|nr:DUF1573 domain-containing protein [candidate division GN15 bacterium]